MLNHVKFRWVLLLSLGVGNVRCDEALPPFENPSDVVKAGVIRARYINVVDDNSVEITLTVRHQYDETLEGETNLNGSVTIELPRSPSIKRTIPFNYLSLVTNQKYNSTTRILRFDPGDTLIFRIRWNFVDDQGDSLKNTTFRYNADPNCPLRCIAEEEEFVLTAKLRLFDQIPESGYGPIQFSVCYVSQWIDSQACPPINTSVPCSYFPSVRVPCDSSAM